MKIVILFNDAISVSSRVGDPVSIDDVAKVIMQELPERLARLDKKQSPRVAVAAYKYRPEDTKYDIRIIATDVDPTLHDPSAMPVKPYDRVWHTIIGLFTEYGWLFPSACFRYDTNEHGMQNVPGEVNKTPRSVYEVW